MNLNQDIQYIKVRDVKDPQRGTDESAGIDFFIPNDFYEVTLSPGESAFIPSGIKMIVPKGFSGNFYNKSGIGKKSIIVGAQVVDSDYRGEVHLNVINVGTKMQRLQPGQKLVQMLVQPMLTFKPKQISPEDFELQSDTERGEGGFGSTGVF